MLRSAEDSKSGVARAWVPSSSFLPSYQSSTRPLAVTSETIRKLDLTPLRPLGIHLNTPVQLDALCPESEAPHWTSWTSQSPDANRPLHLGKKQADLCSWTEKCLSGAREETVPTPELCALCRMGDIKDCEGYLWDGIKSPFTAWLEGGARVLLLQMCHAFISPSDPHLSLQEHRDILELPVMKMLTPRAYMGLGSGPTRAELLSTGGRLLLLKCS